MTKWTFCIGLCACLFTVNAPAAVRSVVSAALGSDFTNISMNQTISLISPFQNTYVGSHHDINLATGLFVGVETQLLSNNKLLAQFGVSYDHTNHLEAEGHILQFANPNFDNFIYQYNIQSERFFFETKLLTTMGQYFHPFVTLGAGEAVNRADQYKETALSSDSVPMSPGFNGHTSYSFAYLWGVGIEMDLNDHFRLGGLYHYVNLGQIRLGTSSSQTTTDTLNNNHLNINEILLQLSYLG